MSYQNGMQGVTADMLSRKGKGNRIGKKKPFTVTI